MLRLQRFSFFYPTTTKTEFDSFSIVIRKYVGEGNERFYRQWFVKNRLVQGPDKSSQHCRQKLELVWNLIRMLGQGGG